MTHTPDPYKDNNGIMDEDAMRDNTRMYKNDEQPQLAEDNETPATPAVDTDPISPDHPILDNYDDIDSHEAYDTGITNASGANDQHEDTDLKDDALHGNDDLHR